MSGAQNMKNSNISILCRVCLADCKPVQTKYIFGKWQPPWKSPATDAVNNSIADLLCELTKTNMKHGDKFPDHICTACFQHFWKAYAFIQRVRQNDKIMRKNWKYFKNVEHNKSKIEKNVACSPNSWQKPITIETTHLSRTQFDNLEVSGEVTISPAARTAVWEMTDESSKKPIVLLEKLNLDVDIKEEVETEDYSSDFVNGKAESGDENEFSLDKVKEEIDIKVEANYDLSSDVPSLEPGDRTDETLNGYYPTSLDLNSEIKVEPPDDKGSEAPASNPELDNSDPLLVQRIAIVDPLIGVEPPPLTNALPEGVDVKIEITKEQEELDACTPLDCLLCGKACKTLTGIKAHVIAWHSYRTISRSEASGPPLEIVERKKPRSKIAAAKKSVLKTKIADKFLDQNLYCKICRKNFQTNHKYKAHMDTHKKTFKCSTCSQTFTKVKLYVVHSSICKKKNIRTKKIAKKQLPKMDTSSIQEAAKVPQVEEKSRLTVKEEAKNKEIIYTKQTYVCKECNESFDEHIYLKIHNEIHHTPLDMDVDDAESKSDSDVRDSNPERDLDK